MMTLDEFAPMEAEILYRFQSFSFSQFYDRRHQPRDRSLIGPQSSRRLDTAMARS